MQLCSSRAEKHAGQGRHGASRCNSMPSLHIFEAIVSCCCLASPGLVSPSREAGAWCCSTPGPCTLNEIGTLANKVPIMSRRDVPEFWALPSITNLSKEEEIGVLSVTALSRPPVTRTTLTGYVKSELFDREDSSWGRCRAARNEPVFPLEMHQGSGQLRRVDVRFSPVPLTGTKICPALRRSYGRAVNSCYGVPAHRYYSTTSTPNSLYQVLYCAKQPLATFVADCGATPRRDRAPAGPTDLQAPHGHPAWT